MGATADKAAGLESARDRLEERLTRLGEFRADPGHMEHGTLSAIFAEADALSQLVIADEIKGLRDDLATLTGDQNGAGSIRDQIGWMLDSVQNSIRDMSHNISNEAMRHRPQ